MRSPVAPLLSALVVVALAVACSPSERDVPTAVTVPNTGSGTVTSVVDGGGEGGADGGAVKPEADAAADAGTACLPQASFSLDGGFGGTYAIRGTISFPAILPAQRVVLVSIVASVGNDVHQQAFATAAASDRFTYRIGGLTTNKYIVRIQADAGGNGTVTETGDYDGYYDGTSAGPILVRANATPVDVKGACLDLVDFGAGVKP